MIFALLRRQIDRLKKSTSRDPMLKQMATRLFGLLIGVLGGAVLFHLW